LRGSNHTLIGRFLHHRIVHEAYPETSLGVDRPIVAAHAIWLPFCNLFIGPDLLDPTVVAALLVADAISVFAAEDELIVVAFDVSRNAYRDVELLEDFVTCGADIKVCTV
jgi:hypothetical protein